MTELYCLNCYKNYNTHSDIWKCECGSPLNVRYTRPIKFLKQKITNRKPNQWRYREALPVEKDENIVTLGEGFTPLVEAKIENTSVYLKLDYLLPTGSFKDRGASVMVSKLKENGIKEIIEDSSGNGGASIAAYCAKANIKGKIYVPYETSAGKLLQIKVFNAQLIRVKGDRDYTAQVALKTANQSYYAGHSWNPFFIEGTKTIAYEIWEQLNWKVPDNIILPVGSGTLLLGMYYGFRDLLQSKKTTKLPQIFAVQSENCCPLYQMYIYTLERTPQAGKKETIAEGIKVWRPVRTKEIIKAVKDSKGTFMTVSDVAIWESFRLLGKLGFYVEPTSAVAIAAFGKLLQTNKLKTEDITVIPLTGTGLKATDKILKWVDID